MQSKTLCRVFRLSKILYTGDEHVPSPPRYICLVAFGVVLLPAFQVCSVERRTIAAFFGLYACTPTPSCIAFLLLYHCTFCYPFTNMSPALSHFEIPRHNSVCLMCALVGNSKNVLDIMLHIEANSYPCVPHGKDRLLL